MICLTCFVLMLMFTSSVKGDEPAQELLWPNGAPGARGDDTDDRPKLICHTLPQSRSSGTAIVIFPGGGYGNLAMGHEGADVAAWLNEHGIQAFVCDYRHRGKGYGHPAPLQDARRAIRIVRSQSEEIGVDANRIGVLGFSAGGHLASTVATHLDESDDGGADPINKYSCRPDFAILCYPVIAFGEAYTHKGSQRNLIGKDASQTLVESYSNQKRVTKNTPPAFLWHAAEDKAVPAVNSVVFFQALQSAGVSAELHIYGKGGHGIGLAAGKPGAKNWPNACLAWLKSEQLLNEPR